MPRKHSSKRKTVKKGGYYSFSGDVATGAPNWTRHSEMGDYAISSRGGNTQYGTGRKKSKKGGKKRTLRKKKMKGGSSYAQAVSGFTGNGVARGLGGFEDVSSPMGKAAGGDFANYGAQPGSGFKSFITTSK
jgi:hypothetical protein